MSVEGGGGGGINVVVVEVCTVGGGDEKCTIGVWLVEKDLKDEWELLIYQYELVEMYWMKDVERWSEVM